MVINGNSRGGYDDYWGGGMRKLTDKTKLKVLKQAAIIVGMNGSRAGNRCCQDWSGIENESPESLFTESELDDLSYNYEVKNSNLEDYEKGFHMMHDEMVASFVIQGAIESMIFEIENDTSKTSS